MTTQEQEPMMRQLQAIAEDWRTIQTLKSALGERLAQVRRLGATWRLIARETAIPMTMVRRYAKPHLADEHVGQVGSRDNRPPDRVSGVRRDVGGAVDHFEGEARCGTTEPRVSPRTPLPRRR
ncbi:MAG: hypothetical protein ACRDZO_21465 [Egibacteraceae bacterium]